jgi:hypothetical protein
VVSREEIRCQLWGEGVYVDFDRALNRAVVKLREALGDLAESPRFIETLPRIGYRFIAPVDGVVEATEVRQIPPATGPQKARVLSTFVVPSVALLGLLVLVILWAYRKTPASPRVLNVVELSKSRESKLATVVSGGSRLYFAANFGGAVQAAQVSTSGGDVVPIATSLNNYRDL